MGGYKFRGQKVIINGEEQRIVPGSLPGSPADGHYAIDSSDGKFKVYNESKARWIILGDAQDVVFDNSTNGFDSNNVQDAIEEANKSKFYAQFQLIGDLNYDEYIYSYSDIGDQGLLGNKNRSGNSSNGYRYSNSAPIICPFNGTLKKGIFAIKGVAVSTGSAASTVTVNFEIWSVGFQNEGTKLGDININIDSGTYTIGTWWNSSVDTNFKGSETYDISITEGDLLALKFKRIQNSSNAVEIDNATVVLEIEES